MLTRNSIDYSDLLGHPQKDAVRLERTISTGLVSRADLVFDEVELHSLSSIVPPAFERARIAQGTIEPVLPVAGWCGLIVHHIVTHCSNLPVVFERRAEWHEREARDVRTAFRHALRQRLPQLFEPEKLGQGRCSADQFEAMLRKVTRAPVDQIATASF